MAAPTLTRVQRVALLRADKKAKRAAAAAARDAVAARTDTTNEAERR
jgi:hypothetical protein